MQPLLYLHIAGATIGLLAGYGSMFVRKGSGLHGAAGTIFGISMLCMSWSAVIIATFYRPLMLNVVAGLLTSYLVLTGWRAARQRRRAANAVDVVAILLAIAVFVLAMRASRATSASSGAPAVMCVVFGVIALACAVADVRMLLCGGYDGARRIARHLWRMGVALLIATFSFFPGQARLFSKAALRTFIFYMPHILLVIAIVYWLVRMRRRRRIVDDPAIAMRVANA